MTINKSGLHPLGKAVLVLPFEEPKGSSLIVLPEAIRKNHQMLEAKVTVLEVGPSAWDDEVAPRASPGDMVLIAKHSGAMAQGLDGKAYRLVNDRDIYCRLETK